MSLIALLSGCDQAAPPQQDASPSSQQATQDLASSKSANRVVAPQTKNTMVLEIPAPWSTSVLKTEDGALLAGLSHADSYLQLWSISTEREVIPLAEGKTGFHPDAVRWVDWDQDGAINELLVTAEGEKKIEVWRYQGDTLQKINVLLTDDPPQSLIIADLDQDGLPDLISGPYEGTRVTVLWQQSDLSVQLQFLAAGQDPTYPKVVDWDNDGLLDIIWSDWQSDSVRWAKNVGQREFKVDVLLGQTGSRPRETAVGDIDGDGHSDLLIALELGKSAAIYYGDGKGQISGTESIPAQSNGYISAAVHRDSDSKETILALAEWEAVIVAQRVDGGTWSYWRRATLGSMPQDLQFMDIDGDNQMDLIFANSAGNQIEIFFGPIVDNMKTIQF
ncbi:MAG: VCBS repeat-containing protein [Gammaproteobacteria bacterium]